MSDLTKEIDSVISGVGGKENIAALFHCVTRLRFTVKDFSKVKKDELEKISGVIQVVTKPSDQCHVVVGTKVNKWYDEIVKKYGTFGTSENKGGEKSAKNEKNDILSALFDTISSIFVPILPGLAAAGMLKGALVALSQAHFMSADGGTYLILYALADAIFYFMPLALSVSAAKKFGANQFTAFAVVAAMVYPSILSAAGENAALSLFGAIPLKPLNYTNSVLPPIIVVYFLSKVEKLLTKIIPSLVKMIFIPLLAVLIVFPIALAVIGPVTTIISNAIASAFSVVYALNPMIAGALIGGIWTVTIVTGFHWGFFPIVMNNIGVFGYDTLLPLTVGTNFASAGAAFGVFLKSKSKKIKELSGSSAFSAFIGGITEPAVYGVNLKYKRPFAYGCVFSAIAGAIVGAFGGQYTTIMPVCAVTIPALLTFKGGVAMTVASIIAFTGTAIATYFVGFDDTMENKI